MQVARWLVDQVREGDAPRFVLRRVPSGQVLTDGSPGGPAVPFRSRGEAAAFVARFLDEPAAWEPSSTAAPAGH